MACVMDVPEKAVDELDYVWFCTSCKMELLHLKNIVIQFLNASCSFCPWCINLCSKTLLWQFIYNSGHMHQSGEKQTVLGHITPE